MWPLVIPMHVQIYSAGFLNYACKDGVFVGFGVPAKDIYCKRLQVVDPLKNE